jgi:hypothetical protein
MTLSAELRGIRSAFKDPDQDGYSNESGQENERDFADRPDESEEGRIKDQVLVTSQAGP